jgi:hypothetical protein
VRDYPFPGARVRCFCHFAVPCPCRRAAEARPYDALQTGRPLAWLACHHLFDVFECVCDSSAGTACAAVSRRSIERRRRQVPAYFALILRAFSVIEGIALRVDPSYSIVKARPRSLSMDTDACSRFVDSRRHCM